MDRSQDTISVILRAYEESVASMVLYSFTEFPFQMGVKRIIDFLKGNRNAFALNNELNLLSTFSALPGYTRDQISDILDTFIKSGLLEVEMIREEDDEYPVISITDKGKKLLGAKLHQPFGILDILMDRDNPEIPEEDQDLYYKLKLARRQLAEEDDYPAFMVCSDDVLKDMCLRKPMEADDLLKIYGVDMAFMKHYSKQFLYVIRQYVTREKGS